MTGPGVKARMKVHAFFAVLWTLAAIPAFLWWADAVWFVILCSLFANIYSAWSATEATDGPTLKDIQAIKADIREIKESVGQ